MEDLKQDQEAKSYVLVVTQPFGDRAIGDEITDPGEIDTVLEDSPGAVVRRAIPVEAPAEDQPLALEAPAPDPVQAVKPSKADKA